MELEELKNKWNMLNERLAENEILNKRIIKEMITNRTQSARNRLFRFELGSLLVVAFFCIFVPIMCMYMPVTVPAFLVLEVTMLLALISQIYSFSFLMRFDLENKNICELAALTLRFKSWIKNSFIYGIPVGILVLILFLIFQQGNLTQQAWRYYLAGAIIVVIAFLTVLQFRYYKQNISTIEKGLDELKSFDPEEKKE